MAFMSSPDNLLATPSRGHLAGLSSPTQTTGDSVFLRMRTSASPRTDLNAESKLPLSSGSQLTLLSTEQERATLNLAQPQG